MLSSRNQAQVVSVACTSGEVRQSGILPCWQSAVLASTQFRFLLSTPASSKSPAGGATNASRTQVPSCVEFTYSPGEALSHFLVSSPLLLDCASGFMAAPTSGLRLLGYLLLLLLLATPTWVTSASRRHPKSQANSLSSDVGRPLSQGLGGDPFSLGGTSAPIPGLAPPHFNTRCPFLHRGPPPPVVWLWAHSAFVPLLSLWPASSARQALGWRVCS